ncbi:MAG: hypothetical protein ACRDCQ_01640 [Aeromonas sobria]
MSEQQNHFHLTLQLDPSRDNDRYALAMLQEWYNKAVELHQGCEAFDFGKVRLHKEVYLSGLYLCMLKPKLCKLLASNMIRGNITPDFIAFALAQTGLQQATEPDVQIDYAELAHQLATKLDHGEPWGQALTSQILEQLATASPSTPLGSANEAEITLLRTQLGQVSELVQQQTTLIREQGRLLKQLAISGITKTSTADGPNGRNDGPMANLSATAAKVRKVRSKGVF